MAKVILIIEDDFETDGLFISDNISTFKGEKITPAMVAVMLLNKSMNDFFGSSCKALAAELENERQQLTE